MMPAPPFVRSPATSPCDSYSHWTVWAICYAMLLLARFAVNAMVTRILLYLQ